MEGKKVLRTEDMMDRAEARILVALVRAWLFRAPEGYGTARHLAYEEEGGGGGEGAHHRARARLYRLARHGFVRAARFIPRGRAASLLVWQITRAGRLALHRALSARCPFCGSVVGAALNASVYPLAHHKKSCYATREIEAALAREFQEEGGR